MEAIYIKCTKNSKHCCNFIKNKTYKIELSKSRNRFYVEDDTGYMFTAWSNDIDLMCSREFIFDKFLHWIKATEPSFEFKMVRGMLIKLN